MLTAIRPEFVELMPSEMDGGILYISKKYRCAIHLCCCGCLQQVVTPLDMWTLSEEDGVSLSPSIGNWNLPCRSHYFIRTNKVEWC